ncbi:uncharacterized protein SPSK_10433 [Sporothrix schenckii 1099-18]|uniref:Uncharacterized protein n=1 Tax=Sporothrix schenckii 1099-18 TaxID=1397361 RepID=A0A0F2MEQ3_SPOSC|nr:uncharacterized protein SPSK_10433 [Sporothrix schenckii 1099-18]KJR87335.1 hypothetical protein SPSK_10433 [Sporothrix schenckii 1099-18]
MSWRAFESREQGSLRELGVRSSGAEQRATAVTRPELINGDNVWRAPVAPRLLQRSFGGCAFSSSEVLVMEAGQASSTMTQ